MTLGMGFIYIFFNSKGHVLSVFRSKLFFANKNV